MEENNTRPITLTNGVTPPRPSENPYFLRPVAIFSIKNARYISLEINI